jgi:putative oxidoreductase
MKIARFATRAIVGGLFIGHGTQKLAGWFGGPGLEGAAAGFESMGLRPGKRNAIAAGAAETAGGALLALGAATPLAGAALIGTMITAIRTVHWKNGPWAGNGGYEYNLVLIAVVLALTETGPGSPSIDSARGSEANGPKWAILSLLAGIAGAVGAHIVAGSAPAPEPTEPEADSSPAPATAAAEA